MGVGGGCKIQFSLKTVKSLNSNSPRLWRLHLDRQGECFSSGYNSCLISSHFLSTELDSSSGDIASFRFPGLSFEGVEVATEFSMVVTVTGRIDLDKSSWSCEDSMVDF